MQLLLLGGTTITKKKNDGVTASTASLNLPAGYSVANIFIAKAGNGSYEELGEIVTASKNDYASYQIQIYTDLKNPSNPVRGTPAYAEPFEYTQALAGYAATMRVENVFSLIFVSIGNAVSPFVSQNLGANKTQRIKKGYHAALVLDVCFAALAFLVIETLHTQISSLFLGKDGTALAYQVSGDYMRWLGYFFIFMGIKMATDGVLRGLGIMQPFLIANMVNLAIRLSVALIGAPRFGIDFVWLAVPAGWLANFLVSYAALRKSWPAENVEPSR